MIKWKCVSKSEHTLWLTINKSYNGKYIPDFDEPRMDGGCILVLKSDDGYPSYEPRQNFELSGGDDLLV